MTSRAYASVGWLSGIVFWITYFLMSGIRADYFHKTKAVSELGSVGASNAFYWNAIGFGAVGVLISIFAIGLHKSVSQGGKGRTGFVLLFACGLFWMLAGVFPGDFENRESRTMIVHAVAALGSGLCFILSVFFYIPAMRCSARWRGSVPASVAAAVAFIASGFLRTGSAPALGQKIGFSIFFIWIALLAFKIFQSEVSKNREQGVPPGP